MRIALTDLPERLRKRIIEAPCPIAGLQGGCWIWQGRYRNGYGIVDIGNDSPKSVHILAYELLVGPRILRLTFDHLCRVRACCQPLHLEQVTNKVNCLRGDSPPAINARKTHCKKGHEFTPSNTVMVQSFRKGKLSPQRVCRICSRAKTAKWNLVHKQVRVIKNGKRTKVYIRREVSSV